MLHLLVFLTLAVYSFLLGLPWLAGGLALVASILFVTWVIIWFFKLFDEAAGNDDDDETFDEILTALWRKAFRWKKDVVECKD